MAKKKRVKSDRQLLTVVGWGQVDQLAGRIGKLQRDIGKEEMDTADAIEKLKSDLAKKVKPLQESITLYTESIEAWCVAHRNEFGDRQSLKINHGTVGWRKSALISVKNTTLDLIKAVFGRKAPQYMHVKESPNKEAMAKLTDEQLASVGARRRQKEAFFVEPDTTEAAEL